MGTEPNYNGFAVGCKSEKQKPANIYDATTVASSDVSYIDAKGNSYASTNKIEFTPLDYAKNVIATSHDPQMVKIAHVILDGATLSETLDRVLIDRNNLNPAASKKLNDAAIEFGRKTHHSTIGVFGAADSLKVDAKHDAAVSAAYEARDRTAEVTGNFVMDNAELFQKQGVKAASKIQGDFDALGIFAVNAKTIEGIQVK